jgi:hypothetical protein
MANLLLVGDARADERGANWIRQSSVVSTSRRYPVSNTLRAAGVALDVRARLAAE